MAKFTFSSLLFLPVSVILTHRVDLCNIFSLHFAHSFGRIVDKGSVSLGLAIKKIFKASASRYVIIGITTWLLDNGLFSLLKLIFGDVSLFFGLTTIHLFTAVGMIVGFFYGFFMNKKWTFQSDGKTTKQFIRCVLLLIFNTVISAVIVDLSAGFGISFLPDLVKYGMSGVIGIWNYFAYKLWVYK